MRAKQCLWLSAASGEGFSGDAAFIDETQIIPCFPSGEFPESRNTLRMTFLRQCLSR